MNKKNRKIAKNTLMLYFRQILVMGVTFFTVRIVLEALGFIDYGINNVVGGVVTMFNFMRKPLVGTTQRFINVEMVNGSKESLQKVVSTSLMLYVFLGLIFILLGQTVGLWFLENVLVIPAERLPAARWVYQFALFGFLMSMIKVPFEALIIAHEDMHIYGYAGIFEAIMKLVIAYTLLIIHVDKLKVYSLFVFLVSCILALFYISFSLKKYSEAKISFTIDKFFIKEIGKFGGFVFGDNLLVIIKNKGINIILNIFFGPAVNAAKGIAFAFDSAFLSFSSNFNKAIKPQLTKTCSINDTKNMWSLMERGTRFSFFLVLIFAVPIMIKTDFILYLWLKNVPEYTVIFVQLKIMEALFINSLLNFLEVMVNAKGKLKRYYSVNYVCSIMIFVMAYIVCKIGYAPYYVFYVSLLILGLSIPVRFIILKKILDFSIGFYSKKVLWPVARVSMVSFLTFFFINKLLPETIMYSFIVIIASVLWTGMVIMIIGMKSNERKVVFNYIRNKFYRKTISYEG